jgi:hypothetical protein
MRCKNGDNNIVAVADVTSKDGFRIIYSGKPDIYNDLTWQGDNRNVVFLMHWPLTNSYQMVRVDRRNPQSPERLPGQPDEWNIYDLDCSHDGASMIYSAIVPPQMIEWSGAETPQ